MRPMNATVTALVTLALLLAGLLGFRYIDANRACRDFTTQPEAQVWSDAHNQILDRDKDGVACEKLLKK